MPSEVSTTTTYNVVKISSQNIENSASFPGKILPLFFPTRAREKWIQCDPNLKYVIVSLIWPLGQQQKQQQKQQPECPGNVRTIHQSPVIRHSLSKWLHYVKMKWVKRRGSSARIWHILVGLSYVCFRNVIPSLSWHKWLLMVMSDLRLVKSGLRRADIGSTYRKIEIGKLTILKSCKSIIIQHTVSVLK